MSSKFYPAPKDKHAEDQKPAGADKKIHQDLEEELKDSFPASDPVSATHPKESKPKEPKQDSHD
jgi:hypothetical protein